MPIGFAHILLGKKMRNHVLKLRQCGASHGLALVAARGLTGKSRRMANIIGATMVLALSVATPRTANALVINATFGTGFSASSLTVVNNAIAFYQNTFSDNITVNLAFRNMTTGLGSSNFFLYNNGYAAFSAALAADKTSADDITANVIATANNPVTNGSGLWAKSANLRAIGINQAGQLSAANCGVGSGSAFDTCIGLNLAITDDQAGPSGYSLISVVEHEIDEALGLGSSLGLNVAQFPSPEDLFRYSANGVRSFAMNASCSGPTGQGPLAYFSIDGGATNINTFNNCNNGGDYADWITHTPSQVQDAFTNNTGKPFLTATSTEVRALDVIGWTLKAQTDVPEPSTLPLLATGLAGVAAFMRRRKSRA
jgi:hypothetical protein